MSEVAPDLAHPEELPPRPVRLREAREAAGLHIAALAAALKVPVRKLEALEAGRYDELPDMTFARALASSACRQLKIDPAPVLAQLPQSPRPALVTGENALNAPFKSASDAPPVSPLSWLSRPAVLATIAVLLGALVIVFLPQAEPTVAAGPSAADTTSPPAEAPPITPVAPLFQPGAEPAAAPAAVAAAPGASATEATAAPAAADVAPLPVVPATPTPPTPPAAPLSGNPPTAAVAPAPPAPAPAPTVAASAGAVIGLVASEESWAEVTNGTGTVVLQRLLQPGERVEFSAAPPYAVVLGNAAVVQVTLRGRPFDAAAIARNNVARFEAR